MGCLAEADVARVYHSPRDDLVGRLLIPLLRHAVRIRRSTGDVQSTVLGLYHRALAEFLERNRGPGVIRWLTGNRLAERDIRAIRHREAYIVSDLLRSLRDGPTIGRETDWGPRILATLLDENLLEWKVAVTTTEGVYHEKVAMLDDACGHRILLSGSWNETIAGYTRSVERVDVHRSTDDPDRCEDAVKWFEKVWNGEVPGIRVMTVEQAIDEDRITPVEDEPWVAPGGGKPRPELWTPELLFLAVQDKVPPDLRDPYVGTLVNPLPHQVHIHRRILSRQPSRFLLADEVGLGKTIEAGMVVSTMAATGHARKVLVLAPKNVLDQWHQELWEKFQLTSWVFESGRWKDEYAKEKGSDAKAEIAATGAIFDRLPGPEPQIVLVSQSLAMRAERLKDLKATSWDLVILDEAHRARSRKKGKLYRQNNLLVALNALAERTKGLLLLTATPVQLELHELYDLLQPLGLPDVWRDRDRFRDFIQFLADDEPDWRFLFDLAAKSAQFYQDLFGLSETNFYADLASGVRFFRDLPQGQEPEKAFRKLFEIVRMGADNKVLDLSEFEKKLLRLALYRMSPIYQLTCRTTRNLLRRYRDLGVIEERVPRRQLEEPLQVEFQPAESELYRDVQEQYLRPFYKSYSDAGLSKNNVGFVLTIYAKRAASSWASLKKSLQRRLDCVNLALEEWDRGGIQHLFGQIVAQDLLSEGAVESEQEVELEGYEDALKEPAQGVDLQKARKAAEEERVTLKRLVARLEDLSARKIDSKETLVVNSIPGLVARRRGLLVFSQFKDTVDDLADALLSEYGTYLAKYHGGGGEVWDGTRWVLVDKATVENRVKSGRIRVLVATDAASEGLNLQALDAVMNYDLPWNPMRIEQRIGRIDRLNQLSETISIYVVLPRATVEETVYVRCVERMGLFRESMGPLQPILIEEFVTRALLHGKDVGQAVNDAIEEWSTARKHAELLEEALVALMPVDEWGQSRDVERRTLQALVQSLDFQSDGPLWVRGKRRVSILQPVPGAELLTAAPSNRVFEELLAELGPIPEEFQTGEATYRLVPCRTSFAFAVKSSPSEGWYLVQDLTRLDGRGGVHVGTTEADIRGYVEALDCRRSKGLRRLQDAQRNRQREAWKDEVIRRVLAPTIRYFSGDVRRAAEEIAGRTELRELWIAFKRSESEVRASEIAQQLSEISNADSRGRPKNIGLIVAAAKEVIRKTP